MRKVIAVGILIFLALIQLNWVLPIQQNTAHDIIRNWLIEEINNSHQELSLSILDLTKLPELKNNYSKARTHYKHVEFFVEYYSPREARNFINGPLVPKVDTEMSNEAILPHGFQRIEELLFKSSEIPDTIALRKEYNLLIEQLSTINKYYKHVDISDGQLLEMCQLELFRISAMNLNGYDATVIQTNVKESLWCMEGIENVIRDLNPTLIKGSK